MGRLVRGEGDFEFEYPGTPCLCDLAFESGAGRTMIFPEITFCEVDDGEDFVCHLSGGNNTIPVDESEASFDAFRDFFMSLRSYFENADIEALAEILEGDVDRDDSAFLKMINSAENVVLSAVCYYTLEREEWPILLGWINENLEVTLPLMLKDVADAERVAPAVEELSDLAKKDEFDIPLLGLLILRDAISKGLDAYTVRDVDDVWLTPVFVEGELVTPETEIGECEDYMF